VIPSVDCTILGDSIAVGVSRVMSECRSDAAIGRATPHQSVPLGTSRLVVISLGSNDSNEATAERNLRHLRSSVRAERVVWLIPTAPLGVREVVRRVAHDFGDRIIDVQPQVGRDGVHPTETGYHRLAQAIRNSR
jgi:lysophospholipase L1-like esterase